MTGVGGRFWSEVKLEVPPAFSRIGELRISSLVGMGRLEVGDKIRDVMKITIAIYLS